MSGDSWVLLPVLSVLRIRTEPSTSSVVSSVSLLTGYCWIHRKHATSSFGILIEVPYIKGRRAREKTCTWAGLSSEKQRGPFC